jgi:hypothetical protein
MSSAEDVEMLSDTPSDSAAVDSTGLALSVDDPGNESSSAGEAAIVIDLPDFNKNGYKGRILEFIVYEVKFSISTLAVRSRRGAGSDEELLLRSIRFVNWLGTLAVDNIPPAARHRVKESLRIVFDEKNEVLQKHFTPEFKDQAACVFMSLFPPDDELLVAELTTDPDSESDDDSDKPDVKKAGGRATKKDGAVSYRLRLPPATHQIYGTGGIMNGIAVRRTTKKLVYIINPTLKSQQKNANVYGHNNLQVGAWYPLQVAALYNGAHGAMQAGIAGHKTTGAFSIVISRTYDDLDRDMGPVVEYSGSGSHNNTDPTKPAKRTDATTCLFVSKATKRPVRVLRASGGSSKWSPSVGIRYDGLYVVDSYDLPKNKKGGLYERFRLKRVPGQPDLDEIVRTVPSAQQKGLFSMVKDGY